MPNYRFFLTYPELPITSEIHFWLKILKDKIIKRNSEHSKYTQDKKIQKNLGEVYQKSVSECFYVS